MNVNKPARLLDFTVPYTRNQAYNYTPRGHKLLPSV
jgi:hypothetical protein